MPHLVAATRAQATEGEMVQALQRVFGTYAETPAF
jgi:methylmalonyl-CoA mutase N-terminal domain/subunit